MKRDDNIVLIIGNTINNVTEKYNKNRTVHKIEIE